MSPAQVLAHFDSKGLVKKRAQSLAPLKGLFSGKTGIDVVAVKTKSEEISDQGL